MIRFRHHGNFNNAERFLSKSRTEEYLAILNKYGKVGVDALISATPVDTGITSGSWGYRVAQKRGRYTIEWTNDHIVDGVMIAVIIQYGHGTGSSGYVEGRDYINPAMKPIFDKIADDLYKEVANL